MSELRDTMGVKGRVLAILKRADGTEEEFECSNLVTTAGDQFYAEAVGLLASASPVEPSNFTDGAGNFDGVMELYTGAITPADTNDRADAGTIVSGSEKAIESTYPKENDTTTENTGGGVAVLSYKYFYAAGVATSGTAITHCLITNPTPGSAEPLLMIANFSGSFTKAAGDTLTVYVNHTFAGS